MDIFNKLKVGYTVKNKKGEFFNYTFLVDGEDVLIKNPNFSLIHINEQREIVNSLIKIDRLSYKIKDFFDIKWEEIEDNIELEKNYRHLEKNLINRFTNTTI